MRKFNRDKKLLIKRIFDKNLTKEEEKFYLTNLDEALLTLDERQQCVIKKLYYDGTTLRETKKYIIYMGHDKLRSPCSGICSERVRQIEYKALRILRHYYRRINVKRQ